MNERYADRRAAGRALAAQLQAYRDRPDALVLALPRGGVPVAAEVAEALHLPLDVLVVRKLGLPGQPEFAMGAIASGGVTILDEDLIARLRVPPEAVAAVQQAEAAELARRERAYRGDRPYPDLHGRTVILVDDGLATGASMKAAVQAVRKLGATHIVVAAPVGPPDTVTELAALADDVVVPLQPAFFSAVGRWYDDFRQTTDDEVQAILARFAPPAAE